MQQQLHGESSILKGEEVAKHSFVDYRMSGKLEENENENG